MEEFDEGEVGNLVGWLWNTSALVIITAKLTR